MTDSTISTQTLNRNEEDQRAAEKAARAEYLTSMGYQFNPETKTWQLKPKERRAPRIPPEVSRQSLSLPDEDYTDSVCLLLPKGHATLIDVRMFEWSIRFDWQVMGRSIFHIERKPVTYIQRRCGIGKTGNGRFRIPGWTKMVNFTRAIFLAGIDDSCERSNALNRMHRKHIDHHNRNRFDHRLNNLRIATRSQNMHNRGPSKKKSSKYKGVSKLKGKNRWVAQIAVQGKVYYLGTFDDEFKAAQAYNAAVRKYCPEFGYINPLSC